MIISAWLALALAIPVLVLGELLVKRSYLFSRLNLPASVIGGLFVALVILLRNVFGSVDLTFATEVSHRWWTWLISAEPEWATAPSKKMIFPFIGIFFACIGLNASWTTFKRGGATILIFLGLTVVLAVLQNGVGVVLAKAMDQPPLLGLLCGSISLTGGFGTTLSFASELEKTGVPNALNIGLAAATFGVLASALLGGPIGGMLIRKRQLQAAATTAGQTTMIGSAGEGWLSDLRGVFLYGRPFLTHLLHSMEAGVLGDIRALLRCGWPFISHFLLVLACVKAGAWMNYGVTSLHVNVTVLLGSMVAGLLVRVIMDLCGAKWLHEDIVDSIGAVALGIFIAIAMMTVNLRELRYVAAPVLVILAVQVIVMALFAWFITFRLTGRNYDAAIIAGGHMGVGLGQTSNAVANMKALVEVFGPSPNAFIVVVIGSSFLLKFINALNISWFLKHLHY